MEKERLYYLDRLKVLMTVLVVLHHAFITYGAPGGWYYREPVHSLGAIFPMSLFVAVNQSFFMGLFFFLSAYFIPASLERKGTRQFIADRLKRLGIPLLFYSLVLSPLLNYLVEHHRGEQTSSFWHYLSGYHHWVDFGVLWFVAALLLFTLIYVVLSTRKHNIREMLPGPAGLLLSGAILGIVTFGVRLIFPVGWSLQPLGFQLGHFPQYITLFIAGILAQQQQWLVRLDPPRGKTALITVILLIIIGFPALMSLYLADPHHDYFNGGWHLQAIGYALWEQVLGIHIVIFLLWYFRKKNQPPTKFFSGLSRSAFAVYIFHPLVLVLLSLAFSGWQAPPPLKLFIVAPLAVAGSFALGRILVALPFVNKII